MPLVQVAGGSDFDPKGNVQSRDCVFVGIYHGLAAVHWQGQRRTSWRHWRW